jgi:hypothetical protein
MMKTAFATLSILFVCGLTLIGIAVRTDQTKNSATSSIKEFVCDPARLAEKNLPWPKECSPAIPPPLITMTKTNKVTFSDQMDASTVVCYKTQCRLLKELFPIPPEVAHVR